MLYVCTHMHRQHLSFFKVLYAQSEQGPPVQVPAEFSSALNKYITHLELCYPLSNPFSMGPILRLWSFEQLPKFMIKINMWINYKAPGRVVSFSSQWNVSFWIPKAFLLFSLPPTGHFWSWELSLAATSPACLAFIQPSPPAGSLNTKSQQDPNTTLIEQQEVC